MVQTNFDLYDHGPIPVNLSQIPEKRMHQLCVTSPIIVEVYKIADVISNPAVYNDILQHMEFVVISKDQVQINCYECGTRTVPISYYLTRRIGSPIVTYYEHLNGSNQVKTGPKKYPFMVISPEDYNALTLVPPTTSTGTWNFQNNSWVFQTGDNV